MKVLQVLMYHRVARASDPILPEVPNAREFASQMRVLRRAFNVLPLSEAVARLKDGSLPPRAVCITFDDGYRDNIDVAAPILAGYGLPATVFVASGFLDGGIMWNDLLIEGARSTPLEHVELDEIGGVAGPLDSPASRRMLAEKLIDALKYLPPDARLARATDVVRRLKGTTPADLMLGTGDLERLTDLGIEIGAHTVSHPILTRTSIDSVRTEIEENRQFLENAIQKPVRGFAYPNGRPGRDYNGEHRDLVAQLGFDYAVSTAWGSASLDDDVFQLPRIGFPGARAAVFALKMLKSRRDRADCLLTVRPEATRTIREPEFQHRQNPD